MSSKVFTNQFSSEKKIRPFRARVEPSCAWDAKRNRIITSQVPEFKISCFLTGNLI